MRDEHWSVGIIIGLMMLTILVSIIVGSYFLTVWMEIDRNWAMLITVSAIFTLGGIPDIMTYWRKYHG